MAHKEQRNNREKKKPKQDKNKKSVPQAVSVFSSDQQRPKTGATSPQTKSQG